MPKKNQTDALIKQLSGEWTPVEPIAHPLRRFCPWLVFSIIYVVAIVYFIGLRPDMGSKMYDSIFIFEMILVFTTGLFSAVSAAYMCVPDMRGAKWLKHVSFTLIGVFFVWTLTMWGGQGFAMPDQLWAHCVPKGVMIAFLPVAALIYMAKGGSTTQPVLMGTLSIASVAALAYMGLRTTCMSDELGYIFFFHVLPFLVIGTVLGAVARKIFRW